LSLVAEEYFALESVPSDPFAALHAISRAPKECPYLHQEGDDFFCRLLEPNSHMDYDTVLEWLAIGEGCSSSLNSDRTNKLRLKKEALCSAIDKIAERQKGLKRTPKNPV